MFKKNKQLGLAAMAILTKQLIIDPTEYMSRKPRQPIDNPLTTNQQKKPEKFQQQQQQQKFNPNSMIRDIDYKSLVSPSTTSSQGFATVLNPETYEVGDYVITHL
jgi:hypothetical protein